MKLCIAEKPSVAKEIAYIIGAKSRKDGYFEGNGYCVSWTFGHFCTLKMPEDYQAEWKKWQLGLLPMIPPKFDIKLISNSGVKKQFGVLKKLFKEAQLVINCGDAGQEGELIQRWVIQQAKYKGKVLRLWISSLTPEAIRDGFQNLKNANQFDNLYHAGSSRAIGDWLLGMNATRLFTLKYGGYKQVLSIGRVQTPTLAMLVQRHKEIINFVPHPFWELHTIYRGVDFNCQKGRFLKKEEGQALLEKVTGKPFTIVSYEKKKGKETPPSLFDLTSLQVHCNKRFSYTADQTLKIIQKLYEKKVVTYPRVDTTYLPNDMYPKISGILGKMKNYSQFTQPLLGKTIRKSSKVFNDKKVTDHHAIIPTGFETQLAANEQHVYDAIARRFIAAFYPDCIVAKATVIGEVEGIKFKATGKEILEPGWRVLFPKPKKVSSTADTKDKEKEEKILPVFKKGEQGPHEPNLVEKQTQPPKYYTEATLLRAMETAGKQVDDDELRDLMKANGIGRPSTRANIIETLFRRNYVQRKKKSLLPTEVGVQLIDVIQNDLLKSVELTGQWEKKLREIESGNYPKENFLDEMKSMVSGLVGEVKQLPNTIRISGPSKPTPLSKRAVVKAGPIKGKSKKTKSKSKTVVQETCPKCQKGKLLKGKTAYGCSQWKEGCSFRLPFKFMNKKISEGQLVRLLNYGSTIQLKGFGEKGAKVNGQVKFTDDFVLKLDIKDTTSKKVVTKKTPQKETISCPKCKKGSVVKGKTAYGCSHWKSGCAFRVTFDTIRQEGKGKPLTKALVINILQQKR